MKYDTKALEAKMKMTVAAYESNLATIRAGQANASVLNRVNLESYGAPPPITTTADSRVPDARTLVLTPSDRSTLKAMEKAILTSDVGITPANDGTVIRLQFPQQPVVYKLRHIGKIQRFFPIYQAFAAVKRNGNKIHFLHFQVQQNAQFYSVDMTESLIKMV